MRLKVLFSVFDCGWLPSYGLTPNALPIHQFIAKGCFYVDKKTVSQLAAVVFWLGASANRLAIGPKQYVPLHTLHEIGEA